MAELTEKQRIGQIGEDLAARYLENKGFTVVGRNYRKKYGEIDIIAKKGETLHFVEVKSVSCKNLAKNWVSLGDVSRVTYKDEYRPEDNIHPQKLKRLARTIQVYLLEKFPRGEPVWVFDAVMVKLDMKNRKAKVELLENLIL